MTASRCTVRLICWPLAGSRITCAKKKHGNVTYFNVNRHINPTNICVAHCKLCAFGRDPSAPGAYNFSLEEIYARAEQGAREGALEFHIVGGLHPDLPFEYFLEMIRGLKQRCPGVHLKRLRWWRWATSRASLSCRPKKLCSN